MKITAIKGFSDILPGEVEVWQAVETKARQVFGAYNFSEIRIPILEKTELFSRSIGEATDIVEKEMYTFEDRDGRSADPSESIKLTLRPEGTAGVVRAYVESEMYKTEPVRKLYYMGPMFRRERPQKGSASVSPDRRRSVRSRRSVYRRGNPTIAQWLSLPR